MKKLLILPLVWLLTVTPVYAYSDIELIERVVESEAGTQGLKGKQYVADVILNRLDSDHFPNTVEGVITEPHQFSVVSTGIYKRVSVSEETRLAVAMELDNRLNNEILYFNSGPVGGTFVFRHLGHNFGK